MDFGIILYCFVSVCLAFIIKGLVGFGDPLVSTPLLSVVLPNSVITPGLMPVSLLLNARMVWKNRAHFSAKLVLPIAAFVLLGIIPGTLLLRYGSPAKLKLLLGLVIIGLGIEMLTRKPGAQGKPNAVVRSVVSFLSGITAGLFGIDLLFLAYLERVTQKREEFRSNVCFVFLLECLFRGILYLWNGMFTAESLILCAAALPAAFLGMWFGALLDRKISDQTAHKFIIYVFILGGVSNTIYAPLLCSPYPFTVPSALNTGSFSRNLMSLRSVASPSARTATRPVTVPPARATSSSMAWRDPPVEITSSISKIRLPRISSASSRPRYSRWVPAVVMEVSSTWMGSGI